MMLPNFGLLTLRLIVGTIFVAHGYPKLLGGPGRAVSPTAARYLGQGFVQAMEHGNPTNFATMVERIGAPEPRAVAWFVAALEFFGGLMLIVGWFTRLVAFLLAGEMFVAIWRVHWRNGLIGNGGFEFALSMFGAGLALVGAGAGPLSLDQDENP